MITSNPFAYGANHSVRWDRPLFRKAVKVDPAVVANAWPVHAQVFNTDPVLNPAWPFIRDWLKEAAK